MQNLKVAITGHTRGIGSAFADYFKDQEIHGFSRSNGWDLNSKTSCEALLTNLEKFDVFINNAPTENQEYLFSEIYNKWQGQDKYIINVSSMAGNINPAMWKHMQAYLSGTVDILAAFKHYVKYKRRLDSVSDQKAIETNVLHSGKPYTLNMKPAGVRTDMLGDAFMIDKVMSVDDFMTVFDTCWRLKDTTARIVSISFIGNEDYNPNKL